MEKFIQRMEVTNLVSFMIFFIMVGPLCTLFHEIGHGIGAISVSKANVHIYLGPATKDNKENFQIGRLHFHIQWAFMGYAYWGSGLNRRQRVAALAGGPIMSLLLALLFWFVSTFVSQGELLQLLQTTTICCSIPFIMTAMPMTYPSFAGGLKRFPSDGLQLLRLLREKNDYRDFITHIKIDRGIVYEKNFKPAIYKCAW